MSTLSKKTSSLARLKNAFAELLRTQPLEQITVQAIVRQADVNRSTFYRHFLDREDFLTWLTNQMIQEITATITKAPTAMTLDFTGFYAYAGRHRQLLQALLTSKQWPAFIAQLHHVVASNYRQLLLTYPSSIPINLQAEFLIGGHINLINWWFQQTTPPSPAQMATYHQSLSQPR